MIPIAESLKDIVPTQGLSLAPRAPGGTPMTAPAPSRYPDTYAAWRADPEAFWAEAARAIDWIRPADRVFDPDQGPYGRWFAGAEVNACHNAVDRHVAAGRGGQAAIVYDSPVTGTKRSISYAELRDEVAALAGVLAGSGVARGDRVLLYMPMIPEAVIAMLACARIGAIHSVVFGGFAARELATRIEDATPKAILCASTKPCGSQGISPTPASSSSAPRRPPPSWRAATGTGPRRWRTRRRAGSRRPAPRWRRPIRSTCSTPRAPRASRRAWCATPAATSWR
jgi:non-ribosomal peptide synthetase component F